MRHFVLLLGLVLSLDVGAMTAAEYLPEDSDLDPAIPSPEAFLGWEIGDWRITHDQLVGYMYAIANSADRVSIKVIGHTHEQRPLLQLVFTAPQNHARLEQLREAHLRAARGQAADDAPLVVWLGQSIHGNEASGSNAAALIAYYLAASRSKFVTDLLERSIVLLDPSSNPDGLQRFSTWSNSNRSLNPVADRNHRIHNEEWPRARTNHYLFDLNRDWLLMVQPESRARVAEFHRWLPHVLTDQHESSTGRSYFFQPGVPERQYPLLPPDTLAMHRSLAAYHARAMDAAGEPYYTEQFYDDFYIGKGSTYSDINGTIGILFEQAWNAGPEVEGRFGPLTFQSGIANQLRTTLSTLHGADELRQELKRYQAGYFTSMEQKSREAGFAAWVIGDDGDPARARELMEVFGRHQVEFSMLSEDIEVDGQKFAAGHAWVLPVRQRQYALLQGMMERRTRFQDESFYDVSAWTLPLAYNLPYAQLRRMPAVRSVAARESRVLPEMGVAWLIPWRQLEAPRLLQALLDVGAFVQVATTPFTATTTSGVQTFAEGTLQVHVSVQEEDKRGAILSILAWASQDGLEIFSAASSLTSQGQDLGGRDFASLKPLKPLLLTGPGTSSYEAGEIWHHLDQRLGFAPVMVNIQQIAGLRLADYTHFLMTDSEHSTIGKAQQEQIVAWVKSGGILVTIGKSARWAETLCFKAKAEECKDEDKEKEKEKENKASGTKKPRAYADYDDDAVRQDIGGAIVAATIDTTHPLGFGFARKDLALFREGTTLLTPSDNPYSTPVRYTAAPLLSGFIGPERLEQMNEQPAVIAERHGKGLVVRFANNPLYRGSWRGTERMFENSLYFGQLIRSTEIPD